MSSLALKYRPSTFEDLVGQLHAAQSLKNAIEYDKISQSYLFFGSRGVGKTSTARILAKSLNCSKGASIHPCGECSNCIEITEGRNMDVIEMDAASNRGIENIRELRESVKFAPMKSKYKIYIIDEVHMLTNESFNALLKTLEEPPAHVVFIMATTEYHKIPETIISRSQAFAFRKFSYNDIIERLKYILEKEKLVYEDDALIPIAQKAEGSMRDSLSLLDQVIAYVGENKISFEATAKVLGVISEKVFSDLLRAIHSKNKKETLLIIDKISLEGHNLKNFLWDFLTHIKNILLIKEGLLNTESGVITEDEFQYMKNASDSWEKSQLIFIFNKFYDIYSNWSIFSTSKSSEIKASLEIALLELFIVIEQPSISKIVQKLHHLKNAIQEGKTFEDQDADMTLSANETHKNLSDTNKKDITEELNSDRVVQLENQKNDVKEMNISSSTKVEEEIDKDHLLQKEFLGKEENINTQSIFGEQE